LSHLLMNMIFSCFHSLNYLKGYEKD
jgi:hypothetical protein